MVQRNFILISLVFFNLVMGNSLAGPLIKSLILPGWGEASIGAEDKSRRFLLREGGLWLSYSGAGWTQSHYEKAYIQYANEYADIDLQHRSYQFAVDIGNYNSIESFNENKARRRQYGLMIDETIPGNRWRWDTNEHRQRFEKMRITSGLAGKTQAFVIAGLIGHRIVSAINVLYLQRTQGIKADMTMSGPHSAVLSISMPL